MTKSRSANATSPAPRTSNSARKASADDRNNQARTEPDEASFRRISRRSGVWGPGQRQTGSN